MMTEKYYCCFNYRWERAAYCYTGETLKELKDNIEGGFFDCDFLDVPQVCNGTFGTLKIGERYTANFRFTDYGGGNAKVLLQLDAQDGDTVTTLYRGTVDFFKWLDALTETDTGEQGEQEEE